MELKLSHVAIATPELGALVDRLRLLSLKVAETHDVPTERVRAGMIPVAVSPHFRIELLEPTGDDSPIARFLEKRPRGGMHHICFEVRDLPRWKTVLEDNGFEVLPPGIRKAARGKALFVHPKDVGGVLLELEEIEA